MKQKILAVFLAVALSVTTLLIPASAAATTQFSDVTDHATAVSVETLRLMGVLGGYGDGTFRPAGQLTRAQFCKMAAYATDSVSKLGKYHTVTIFPDVKPSHWAAEYINLAARDLGIIGGYPNGTFQPDRTVTVGHAVTILLRLLGYKDEEVGGVWPASYMAAGKSIGLTDGVSQDGNAPLTRAGAARLFVNLLQVKTASGGTLYTLTDETELRSVDGGKGELITATNTYQMAYPVASTSLVGARGRVVLNSQNQALTFLPLSGGSGNASGTVIVYEDRSSAGLADLAGSPGYGLYKNGLKATASDLRRNDVATYYPDTHSIRVADTRVSVYYEACEPSPAAPTKISVLGGTELTVLPSARASLAKFKPGQTMTLLLTADGQVAAAVTPDSFSTGNAVGIVGYDGSMDLLCGTIRIRLKAKAAAEFYGQVVRISAQKKEELNLTVLTGGNNGDFDVHARMVGNRKLADNAVILDGGKQMSLADYTSANVSREQITYARTNWRGEVDLLVLNGGNGSTFYGRAEVSQYFDGRETITRVEIVSDGNSTGLIETAWQVEDGDYVVGTVKDGKYTSLTALTALKKVANSAWSGTSAVTHDGRTYSVPSTVLCYNRDSDRWVTVSQALAYGNSTDLYVENGIVRVIEVSYS